MPLLKGEGVLAASVRDRVDRRLRAREGGATRDARNERRFADEVTVAACAGALRRVHDEVAPSAANQVDDGGGLTPLRDLAHTLDRETGRRERVRRSAGREQAEPEC